MPKDLSTAILKEIRDEVRKTNLALAATNRELADTKRTFAAAIDRTNARIDNTNAHIDHAHDSLRDELSRRIVESEIRTATALADLAGTVREVTILMRESSGLRPRVEQCELAIADLQRKVG